MTEFALIDRIRARAGTRGDVVRGIGDDAALLQVPPGHQLVVTTDTLVAGVHFPLDTPVADLGWKALAVNLSDLAAMGADAVDQRELAAHGSARVTAGATPAPRRRATARRHDRARR